MFQIELRIKQIIAEELKEINYIFENTECMMYPVSSLKNEIKTRF